MNTNQSKLIFVDEFMTAASAQMRHASSDRYQMLYGLRVVKIVRGRHLLGITDDNDIKKALSRGWRIELKKLSSTQKGLAKLTQYEKAGDTGKRLVPVPVV